MERAAIGIAVSQWGQVVAASVDAGAVLRIFP